MTIRVRTERLPLVLCVLFCIPILAIGCAQQEEPVAEEVAQVVEIPETDLRVAAVPAGFELVSTQPSVAEFKALAEELAEAEPADVRIEVGEPSDFGIDLVAITKAQKPLFEAQPGGESHGANRLGTPLGEAWYARGRYDDASGAKMEDIRIFLVHPSSNRLVTISQTYPAADDTSVRMRHLFELLGELEVAMSGQPTDDA